MLGLLKTEPALLALVPRIAIIGRLCDATPRNDQGVSSYGGSMSFCYSNGAVAQHILQHSTTVAADYERIMLIWRRNAVLLLFSVFASLFNSLSHRSLLLQPLTQLFIHSEAELLSGFGKSKLYRG